jgi:hypothetical protein
MRILVAILTNRFPDKLERCIDSVKKQTSDVVVVCNTLDRDFIPQSRYIAESSDVTFVVTESNGTPAKGKNSVLDYFAKTDYDYLFIVDGDDFLNKDAIGTLQKVIDQHPCDVLTLVYGEQALVGDQQMSIIEWSTTDDYKRKFTTRKTAKNLRPLLKMREELYRMLPYNRFLLISKKALPYFQFDESLIGLAEYHLSIKLLHYIKDIVYKGLSSDRIYIYDANDPGNYRKFMETVDGEEFARNLLQSLDKYDTSGEIDVISVD